MPSHYMRRLHVILEGEVRGDVNFIYVSPRHANSERAYEDGILPESHVIVPTDALRQVWTALTASSPKVVIMAGHRPLVVLVALLWAWVNRRHVAYMSDTNLLDVLRGSVLKRMVAQTVKQLLFRFVSTFLYIGTRNRDYYTYTLGRRAESYGFVKVPYPAIPVPTRALVRPGDELLKLLFVGRLVNVKAVENLINAMAMLPADVAAKTSLTIIGDGTCRKDLEVLCNNKGISEKVRFAGTICSDQVGEWLSDYDLLVLPSRHEPWGLVVNEALMAGVPVAAPYWVGAAADLIADGHSGFVLKDNSPDTIAQVIGAALRLGRSRLHAMGKNGRDMVLAGGFHLDAATRTLCGFLVEHSGHEPNVESDKLEGDLH